MNMSSSSSAPVLRVSYQGIAGAFGEEAIWRLWARRAEACSSATFGSALSDVVSGNVDYAVIPVWNSTIGDIGPACDALDDAGSNILRVRHIDIPVRHNLLAREGTVLSDVRYVGSHPAALAQCSQLFGSASELVSCEASDTAGAARELSQFGEPIADGRSRWYDSLGVRDASQLAAIASARSAALYGLVVLRRDLQDDPTNITRFAVLRAKVPAIATRAHVRSTHDTAGIHHDA